MKMTCRRKILVALSATGFVFSATPALAQGTALVPPPPKSTASNLNNLEYEREVTRKSVDGRRIALSSTEQRAIKKIEVALAKKDYAGAAAAISAADRVIKGADAKYALAALQLQLGTETNNIALQDQAVDAAIATGVAPATLLPELYRRQGVAAILANNLSKAETALNQAVALSPQDADSVVLLAETKNRANKPAEALPLLERAISLKTAAGQPVPAEWARAVGVIKAKMQVQR